MLKDILTDLAITSGIKIDTATQRNLLISRINKEAKELYENFDLHNALREQIFQMGDVTDQLVVLPWYVQDIRSLREYDTQLPFQLVDMRPKYQTGEWDNKQPLKFRIKQEQYPLERELKSEGKLTLEFTDKLTTDLTVTITGQTQQAQRVTEVLTFQANKATEQDTYYSYRNIESIRKSSTCNVDLIVYDMLGNKISEIPNCEEQASYTLLQVLEPYQNLGLSRLMLVLYKTRFTPFLNDTDSFPCGDIYDRAIYWKTLACLYSTMEGKETMVENCLQKVNEILVNVSRVKDTGKVRKLDFGQNRFRKFWIKSLRSRFTLVRDNPRSIN